MDNLDYFSPNPFFTRILEELETYEVILLLKVLIPTVHTVSYRAVTRCSTSSFWLGSRQLTGVDQPAPLPTLGLTPCMAAEHTE